MAKFNQKTITIDADTYLVNTIPAIPALKLKPRVIKLLGKSFIEFFTGAGVSEKDRNTLGIELDDNDISDNAENIRKSKSEIETRIMARVAEVFLDDIDKVDIAQLSVDLISMSVSKNGIAIDTNDKFNQEFTGDLSKLYKLLKEVIVTNFLESLTGSGLFGKM